MRVLGSRCRSGRRGAAAALALLGAALATAAPAAAATPFTAGSGERPSVAVGFDGSAHVVWVSDPGNAQVGYCRVGPGGEACNRSASLPFGSSTAANLAGRALVFVPTPGKVVIVASCWSCPTGGNRTYRWLSTDNGVSFASAQIGGGTDSTTNGSGLWLDSAGILVAANGSRVRATNSSADVGPGVQYATGGLFAFSPQVALLPSTGQLVAATNDLESIRYGVYDGALTVPDINTLDSDWSIDRTLPAPEPDSSETALNAGPSGLFLTYEAGGALGMRRFDPATGSFGAATYVQGDDPIDAGNVEHPDSFQDLTGRVHLVWRSLFGGGRLRYRSSPNGTSFGSVGTLAAGESFVDPEIAVGNQTGFAVWSNGSAVRVVWVDPREESGDAPESSPPGGGGGGGTPGTGRAPELSRVGIADRTLAPGQGTTFSFTSSSAGQAVLTIEKRYAGLRGKRRGKPACLPLTRARRAALRRQAPTPQSYRALLRKRSCRAYRPLGEIRQAVRPGVNSIAFDGRVAGRRLGPGAYRARLRVSDAAGQVSREEVLAFTVVRAAAKRPTAAGRR